MKFFWEEDTVFLHLMKYFGKARTNISRVILCGPNCPVTHLAPVSPNRKCGHFESAAGEVKVFALPRRPNVRFTHP